MASYELESEFERKMKSYIKKSGRSLASTAKMLGYHRSTLTKWLKGVNQMPLKALAEFCELVNLNKEQREDLTKLAGYDISWVSKSALGKLEVGFEDKAVISAKWAGIIDIDHRGLDVIKGYDIWFTNYAEGLWKIWHFDSLSGEIKPITFEMDKETELLDQFVPAISPDGTKIAYSAGRSVGLGAYSRDLYLANVDGTNVRKLTNSCLDTYHPSWSPDGEFLVYHQGSYNNPKCSDTNYGIWIMKWANGWSCQLTDEGDYDPVWSPNGQYIAYHSKAAGWGIKILEYKSCDSPVNSCSTWTAADIGDHSTSASWINDHRIIFASDVSGKWDIYEVPVKPHHKYVNPIQLTHNDWDNLYPTVFDNKILIWQAFQHEIKGNEGAATDRDSVIHVMNLDDREELPLLTGIGNLRDCFLKHGLQLL